MVVDAPGLEREYEAEIIGSDYSLDLAVLRIINENGDVFPTLPWAIPTPPGLVSGPSPSVTPTAGISNTP